MFGANPECLKDMNYGWIFPTLYKQFDVLPKQKNVLAQYTYNSA